MKNYVWREVTVNGQTYFADPQCDNCQGEGVIVMDDKDCTVVPCVECVQNQ